MPKRLLCLSNGHGEDLVAVRVLKALQNLSPIHISALPIVGEGKAYRDFPIIAPVQTLPSGGFLYMDGQQLAKDLQGGLLNLTWQQLKCLKAWAKTGDFVLAVGDIVPLSFAWWSGLPYAFVGTARSEYYLRDDVGPLKRQYWWQEFEAWSGCVYQPWERWFMRQARCRGIFPRDTLTTTVLNRLGVTAIAAGNPMMDDLPDPIPSPQTLFSPHKPLQVLLLPGSRAPEAYANWTLILDALPGVTAAFESQPIQFLTAIAPSLDLHTLSVELNRQGWGAAQQGWQLPGTSATLQLSQTQFQDYLLQADCAIALAGTATEQFIGLGKPAIAMPGAGPQYTFRFAEAQSRLLGVSLMLVESPTQVGAALREILRDNAKLHAIAANGVRRMGQPGAAQRIASHLLERLG
jgi:uncharacterized protein (TIGR03492 family)